MFSQQKEFSPILHSECNCKRQRMRCKPELLLIQGTYVANREGPCRKNKFLAFIVVCMVVKIDTVDGKMENLLETAIELVRWCMALTYVWPCIVCESPIEWKMHQQSITFTYIQALWLMSFEMQSQHINSMMWTRVNTIKWERSNHSLNSIALTNYNLCTITQINNRFPIIPPLLNRSGDSSFHHMLMLMFNAIISIHVYSIKVPKR